MNSINDPAADPGHLIAAIPSLLHSSPQEAFVLLLADAGLIQQHQVYPLDSAPHVLFARIANQIRTTPADTAYLIGIAAAMTGPAPTNTLAEMPGAYRALPRAIANVLAENGIAAGIWGTPALTDAAPWWTLTGTPRTGVLHSPSPLTPPPLPVLAALHDPRAEATHVFATDEEFTTHLDAALPAAQHASEDRLAAAIRRGTPDQHFTAELDTIRDYLTTLSSHDGPAENDPEFATEIARICVVLRCERVRSSLYEIVTDPRAWFGPHTRDNVDLVLWGLLVTGTRDQDRAHAATLLALALYIRFDDIAAAEVAIDIAVHADPHHQVAPAVHEAIRQRQHPADLRAAFTHIH
ncbi:DUF4192 family protein [Nocardia sp. NPDC052001]|uniref:DUF4192 family protein n=1 Tax=Nocardia sp. NPDC052001 TaxID=3154853 RepID=UPI00343983AB